jgi:hypothetical protein
VTRDFDREGIAAVGLGSKLRGRRDAARSRLVTCPSLRCNSNRGKVGARNLQAADVLVRATGHRPELARGSLDNTGVNRTRRSLRNALGEVKI